jgi:hypothetical protein
MKVLRWLGIARTALTVMVCAAGEAGAFRFAPRVA